MWSVKVGDKELRHAKYRKHCLAHHSLKSMCSLYFLQKTPNIICLAVDIGTVFKVCQKRKLAIRKCLQSVIVVKVYLSPIYTLSQFSTIFPLYKILTRLKQYAYKPNSQPLNPDFSLAHLQTHIHTKPIKSVWCIVKASKKAQLHWKNELTHQCCYLIWTSSQSAITPLLFYVLSLNGRYITLSDRYCPSIENSNLKYS